jgi:hypothetical protein
MKRSEVCRAVAELAQETGRAPGVQAIATWLDQDLPTMGRMLTQLVAEKFLHEEHGAFRLADPFTAEDPAPIAVLSSTFVGRWQITVIRAVMAAAGVGASIVSGYFTILRLGEFMPRMLATLLGTFLVAFAVIAFETVLVFVQRKGYFIAVLFVALWAIVATFTLTATVAGFYSYYAAVRVDRARAGSGEEVHRIELQSVRSNTADLARRLEDQRRQLGPLQAIVEDVSTNAERRSEYGRVYYDAQNRILAVQREMDRLQAALDVERKKEAGILAEAPAAAVEASRPSQDFYDWTGTLLGVRPATMELVSAIFPSVFIDLISSIGLAVALFLSAETNGAVRETKGVNHETA